MLQLAAQRPRPEPSHEGAWLHESGTYVKFTQAGAELFARKLRERCAYEDCELPDEQCHDLGTLRVLRLYILRNATPPVRR